MLEADTVALSISFVQTKKNWQLCSDYTDYTILYSVVENKWEKEEEMFLADLSLEAEETVKTHLCLCAWQRVELVYT